MSEQPQPRVFIVDDNVLQLEMTARLLRLAGFSVETSSSSFGVTNQVRNFAPNVVLLDVEIPALSGDRLLEIVRRHAPPNTRFVLYSACDESRLRDLASLCDADGWISKSLPVDDLAARLRNLIAKPKLTV
jgi:DNA-binding response OmpR family regulator